MTQVYRRARSLYYLIVVSPALTPGVILGISTVIFWKDLTTLTGSEDCLYAGIFLATVGQATFISAYCMLVFLVAAGSVSTARRRRQRSISAPSTSQVFFHILLPFLKPAILSAAVLAFLSSFENYNTTTFAILADKTLTTVLAGRVRQGTTPAIGALAVIIIVTTLAGAILDEVLKRREDRAKPCARSRCRGRARRAYGHRSCGVGGKDQACLSWLPSQSSSRRPHR